MLLKLLFKSVLENKDLIENYYIISPKTIGIIISKNKKILISITNIYGEENGFAYEYFYNNKSVNRMIIRFIDFDIHNNVINDHLQWSLDEVSSERIISSLEKYINFWIN